MEELNIPRIGNCRGPLGGLCYPRTGPLIPGPVSPEGFYQQIRPPSLNPRSHPVFLQSSFNGPHAGSAFPRLTRALCLLRPQESKEQRAFLQLKFSF